MLQNQGEVVINTSSARVLHQSRPRLSEAERRISFFGQSLSITMPETIPVPQIPTFTVLVLHYSEKDSSFTKRDY